MLDTQFQPAAMDPPQDTAEPTRKDREEVLQAPDQGFPCSLWRTMVEQVPHCSLWRPHAAAGGCVLKEAAASGEPTPSRNCGLWRGVHTGAGFVDLWLVGAPHKSNQFLKDCTPWKGPTLEQFFKNCSLWEGATLEQFIRSICYSRDPPLEKGKSVRRY